MNDAKSSGSARMYKIRLELARSPGAPQGSPGDGYEFYAPLDDARHIDLDGWKEHKALCFVHRLEDNVTVERGILAHRPGGTGGATWAFDYDYTADGDEEPGFRFDTHAFQVGQYVSIRDHDGELQTYRVANVTHA